MIMYPYNYQPPPPPKPSTSKPMKSYKGYTILHLMPFNIYTIKDPRGQKVGDSVQTIREAKKVIDKDPNRLRTLNELFGDDDIVS